jgi:hypothetical protein
VGRLLVVVGHAGSCDLEVGEERVQIGQLHSQKLLCLLH